jgi:5'(3')-deoxyribonucleotidase
MLSDDFFAVLDVMPEAQRVLERLQSRYNVFIATAAMEVPTSFTAKFKWLARHFPFISSSHIVFCGDKGILRADYLIDDNPRQLQRFEAKTPTENASTRKGILYTSPTNVNVTGYRRVHNWLEVEDLFL